MTGPIRELWGEGGGTYGWVLVVRKQEATNRRSCAVTNLALLVVKKSDWSDWFLKGPPLLKPFLWALSKVDMWHISYQHVKHSIWCVMLVFHCPLCTFFCLMFFQLSSGYFSENQLWKKVEFYASRIHRVTVINPVFSFLQEWSTVCTAAELSVQKMSNCVKFFGKKHQSSTLIILFYALLLTERVTVT